MCCVPCWREHSSFIVSCSQPSPDQSKAWTIPYPASAPSASQARSFQLQLLFLRASQVVTEQPPAVFIIMAVHAKVFPVGAVWWVVSAVTIFVVHGQQVPCFLIKFSAALGAYESVDLQRAFPVVTGCRCGLPQLPDDLFCRFTFAGFFRPAGPATASVRTAHTYSPYSRVLKSKWLISQYSIIQNDLISLEG